MNRERVAELADLIECGGPEGVSFDMGHYKSCILPEFPRCGTTACVAGYGYILLRGLDAFLDRPDDDLGMVDVVAEWLELGRYEAESLFVRFGFYDIIPKARAVQMLRHLAAGGALSREWNDVLPRVQGKVVTFSTRVD